MTWIFTYNINQRDVDKSTSNKQETPTIQLFNATDQNSYYDTYEAKDTGHSIKDHRSPH